MYDTRVLPWFGVVRRQVGLRRLPENRLICFTRFTPSAGSRCRRRTVSRQWTPLWASPDGPVHASCLASMSGQPTEEFLRIPKYMYHRRLRAVLSVGSCCEALHLVEVYVFSRSCAAWSPFAFVSKCCPWLFIGRLVVVA